MKKIKKIKLSDLRHVSVSFWILIGFIFLTALVFLFNLQGYIKLAVISYGLIAIFIIAVVGDLSIQPIGPDVPLIFALLFTDLNKYMVLGTIFIATLTAIALSYWLGKIIGAEGIRKMIGSRKFHKMQKSNKYGKIYLTVSAMSPVPYVPYLAGLFELSFSQTMKYLVIPRLVRFIVIFIVTLKVGPVILNWLLIG